MIKILAFSALAFSNATSQIIDRSDFGHSDPVRFGYHINLDEDSVVVGEPDALRPQTFDFSLVPFELTPVASVKTQIPSDVRFLFPQAKRADYALIRHSATTDTVWHCYSDSDNVVIEHGIYISGLTKSVQAMSGLQKLRFPLSIGREWSQEVEDAKYDKKSYTLKYSAKVDAFGTLVLPYGQFEAIRVQQRYDYGAFIIVKYLYLTASAFVSLEIEVWSSKNPDARVQKSHAIHLFSPTWGNEAPLSPQIYWATIPPTHTVGVGQTDTVHAYLKNIGDTTARIEEIFTTPSIGDESFHLISWDTVSHLRAGDSIRVLLEFKPTSTQEVSSFLKTRIGFVLTSLRIKGKGVTMDVGRSVDRYFDVCFLRSGRQLIFHDLTTQPTSASLVGMGGQKWELEHISPATYRIPSNIASGPYMIVIGTSGNVTVKKVILE